MESLSRAVSWYVSAVRASVPSATEGGTTLGGNSTIVTVRRLVQGIVLVFLSLTVEL